MSSDHGYAPGGPHADDSPDSPAEAVSADISDDAGAQWWRKTARRTSFWIALIVVALCVIFEVLSPGQVFLSYNNVVAMALDATEALILALGMTFLLGAKELDLSVGANLILSSVFGAKTLVAVSGTATQTANGQYPHLALGIVACLIVALGCGVAFGCVNGLAVTVLRINSFIATLATTGIGTGIALVVTKGIDVPNLPGALQSGFAGFKVLGIVPEPVLIPVVLVPVFWWVMTRTRFGLHTQAMGSSRQAAERAGIRTHRHLVRLYMLMGALAAIAGFVDISRFGTTSVSSHTTDALAAIAACVIGGTSLFGGKAYIGGTTLGTFIPVILGSGLVIIGISSFWQQVVVGLILLVAVYIDQRRRAVHQR
jgi:ribose transport system permease protein